MHTVNNILEALDLGKREHLAIVGAGGKTSLLIALAERLFDKKVIISTTTKIHRDEASRFKKPIFTLQETDWKERLGACLKRENGALLIGRIMASGKVKGISPVLADEIFREQGINHLLLEADGAAGRPAKAPSEKEPVIPSSVTKVVAIMGLDVINQSFNRETVFREREFRELTGIEPGEKLVPKKLFPLFMDPEGVFKGTPPSAKKLVFLNRLDLLLDKDQAFALADLITGEARHVDRVIVGSIKNDIYYFGDK